MARSNSNTNPKSNSSRAPKDNGRQRGKKPSPFPGDEVYLDYKDVNLLRKFISDRGKIRARRVTGASTQRQRELANAIKLARELALLPYTQRTTTERTGRPPRGDRNDRRPQENNETPTAAEQLGVDVGDTVLDENIEGVTINANEEAN